MVCARTGIVLSGQGGALPKLLPLFKVGLGGRLGSGAQWWSWIALDDEIRAIEWLLEHDVRGPVNLTAPTPVTNREFTAVLSGVLSRPARLPVPKFGPRVLLGTELADALLFTSARVRPEVLESSGFAFSHGDLEAGLRSALESAPEVSRGSRNALRCNEATRSASRGCLSGGRTEPGSAVPENRSG